MPSFVAFLRGINVGGRNPIDMPALAECFREASYDDVRTYIQSGNVLFTTEAGDLLELEEVVEQMLTRRFGTGLSAIVRSREQLAAIVSAAPPGHGSPELRSDVMFLKHPLTSEEVLAQMPELREGVDSVVPGPDVVYFSRVAERATKTRIQRFMSLPVFQRITVRNWRTVTRITQMFGEAAVSNNDPSGGA